MAKSVLDAGWAMFKTQLEYKAVARSAVFAVVNESYSTQACSYCGALYPNSPKGRADLRVRVWACSECGTLHERVKEYTRGRTLTSGCRNPRPLGRGGYQKPAFVKHRL